MLELKLQPTDGNLVNLNLTKGLSSSLVLNLATFYRSESVGAGEASLSPLAGNQLTLDGQGKFFYEGPQWASSNW